VVTLVLSWPDFRLLMGVHGCVRYITLKSK
jgi:hypothetical protein